MNLLREIGTITVVSFVASLLAGLLVRAAAGGAFTVTYVLAALVVGPALAIYRGMKREKDPLTLTERALAELIAIAILLAAAGVLGNVAG